MTIDTLTDFDAFSRRYAKPSPRPRRVTLWPIAGMHVMWAGILAWHAVRESVRL